jgi:hypothetical protein
MAALIFRENAPRFEMLVIVLNAQPVVGFAHSE